MEFRIQIIVLPTGQTVFDPPITEVRAGDSIFFVNLAPVPHWPSVLPQPIPPREQSPRLPISDPGGPGPYQDIAYRCNISGHAEGGVIRILRRPQ